MCIRDSWDRNELAEHDPNNQYRQSIQIMQNTNSKKTHSRTLLAEQRHAIRESNVKNMATNENGKSQLRVGVVGCGYWGSKHVRVLSSMPGIEVSVIDRDKNRRDSMMANYPVAHAAEELSDIVGDLDAVVIATSPTTHYSLAHTALSAGLHTLVEKPLTTNVEDGERLVELADEKDLRLMVGHTFEYNAAVWSLKDIIGQEAFGRVRYINSARLNLGLYQPDVDVLWDLAPHDISIINHVLDSSPTSVLAWGLELMGDKADVAYLSMRYEELDVSAKIHVSWLDPMKVRRTTVVGENEMAVYDDMAEERIRIYDKGIKPIDFSSADVGGYPLSYRNGDIVSPFIDFKEPLQLELTNFVDCIWTGETPKTSGRNGLDVVKVLCAAEKSLETGGWVDVESDTAILDLRDRTLPETATSSPVATH